MAIPGYLDETPVDYSQPEYYQALTPLVGILGGSHTQVVEFIKQMLEELKSNGSVLSSDSSGAVDYSRANTPALLFAKSLNLKIIHNGGESIFWPMGFWAYIDGGLCAFLGTEADERANSWSALSTSQLRSPELYLSAQQNTIDNYPVQPFYMPYTGYNYSSTTFVATFVTRWGETPPSNAVVIHYASSGPAFGVGYDLSWSVTMEVSQSSIPNYAQSVRYYQSYSDGFYLIGEVSL
jgi:hypothetical protein